MAGNDADDDDDEEKEEEEEEEEEPAVFHSDQSCSTECASTTSAKSGRSQSWAATAAAS